MILESGAIIFAGMLFIGLKLKPVTSLKLLGYPLALDIGVSALVLVLHWGTFSGVMAAAFAGLLCSITTTLARKVFGYIERGVYVPGWIDIRHKLK